MELAEVTFTLETLLLFLLVVSVIVWVGGELTLNVLAVRSGEVPTAPSRPRWLRTSDLCGRTVIAPAGILTLITGLPLVNEHSLSLGTLWVAWGLVGLFAPSSSGPP